MLPGDKTKKQIIDSIIRVNHAGEYGAKRIYQGQFDYIADDKAKQLISHMAAQEQEHLDFFANEINKRSVRPTILHPLWHCYGYILGMCTAKLGTKMAMTCTEAVEEVIDEHYLEQLKLLTDDEKLLASKIERFRQEELEHKNIAQENNAKDAACYHFVSALIRMSCKFAIAVSKKL